MLDTIGRILKEKYPEHFGGYLNGWLDVNSYETKDNKKITEVKSSGQPLFTMVEFELDRRRIRQVYTAEGIIKSTSIN